MGQEDEAGAPPDRVRGLLRRWRPAPGGGARRDRAALPAGPPRRGDHRRRARWPPVPRVGPGGEPAADRQGHPRSRGRRVTDHLVSSVPPSIGGLGSTQLKLRASPAFDPLKAKVGPEEYFLFSRFNGTQTLRDVLLESGLPVERAIAIVVKLRSLGALLLPNESTAPAPPPATQPAPALGGDPTEKNHVRLATGSKPPALDTTLPDPDPDELHALSEPGVLTDAQRRRDPRDRAPAREERSMGVARRRAGLRCPDAQARVLQAVQGDPPGPVLWQVAGQLRGAPADGVRGGEPRLRAPDQPRQIGRPCDRRRHPGRPRPPSRRRSTPSSCTLGRARWRSPAITWAR